MRFMQHSRRDVLSVAGLVVAGCALERSAMAADQPKPGLIFPPKARGVPEEGPAMYGSEVEFLVEGLGLETMTPEGYDSVIDRIPPAAESLAERGADAIVLMGTSLSFYKGEDFNQRLTESVREATGLPAVTMSTAVIEGLRQVGGRRIVAATAYNTEVNGRLLAFLEEHGFDVLHIEGLGLEAIDSPSAVNMEYLIDFSAGVYADAPESDAILVSCGGFRTLELLAPLEQRCAVPAVSSTPHALMAGARLLGLTGTVSGYGALLAG
jgi:arylmalonate decarboxylase